MSGKGDVIVVVYMALEVGAGVDGGGGGRQYEKFPMSPRLSLHLSRKWAPQFLNLTWYMVSCYASGPRVL